MLESRQRLPQRHGAALPVWVVDPTGIDKALSSALFLQQGGTRWWNSLDRPATIKNVLNLRDVELSFVVEKGNNNDIDVLRRFKSTKKQDPEGIGSISFVPKQERIGGAAAVDPCCTHTA